jgi:hypothetical protein
MMTDKYVKIKKEIDFNGEFGVRMTRQLGTAKPSQIEVKVMDAGGEVTLMLTSSDIHRLGDFFQEGI